MEKLCVQIENKTLHWSTINSSCKIDEFQEGIENIPQHLKQNKILLLLVGEIQAKYCTLNKQTAKHKQQAIPALLEDELLEDIDALHFHIMTTSTPYQYVVNYINQHTLQKHLQLMQQHHLKVSTVMSAAYALPVIEHSEHQQTTTQQHSLLRKNRDIGIITHTNSPISPDNPPTPRVPYWHAYHFSEENQRFNVLSGQFSQQKMTSKWLFLLCLALLWSISHISLLAWQNQQLTSVKTQLKAQQKSLYLSTFPGATRVVNAKAQMQQKLAQRNRKEEEQFIAWLADFSKAQKNNAMMINNIRFSRSQLDIQLNAQSIEQIEKLKLKMQTLGYRLKIGALQMKKNRVFTSLRISQ